MVEGRKLEAQKFVQALTDADRTRQLARWDRAICPRIVGVDEGQAVLIKQNIARVAESLGLRAYAKGCRTSMLIMFDNDAQAMAAALAKKCGAKGGLKRKLRPENADPNSPPCTKRVKARTAP